MALSVEYIHQTICALNEAVQIAEAELQKTTDRIGREALEGALASADLTKSVISNNLSKESLSQLLKMGHSIFEIFPLSDNFYKSQQYMPGLYKDAIIYIPDLSDSKNSIDVKKSYTDEASIREVLKLCFTEEDLTEFGTKPEMVLAQLSGQHPSEVAA